MEHEKIMQCLIEKREIIRHLYANTATESRFIPRQEMKGLKRVLNERAVLLEQLAVVNNKLDDDKGWRTSRDLKELVAEIEQEQQAVLAFSAQVLQMAKEERDRIKIQLQQIRLKKRIRNRYEGNPVPVYGSRINTKG